MQDWRAGVGEFLRNVLLAPICDRHLKIALAAACWLLSLGDCNAQNGELGMAPARISYGMPSLQQIRSGPHRSREVCSQVRSRPACSQDHCLSGSVAREQADQVASATAVRMGSLAAGVCSSFLSIDGSVGGEGR